MARRIRGLTLYIIMWQILHLFHR